VSGRADLSEDYHVHSTFSDDAQSSLEDNLVAARARGLSTVCFVEHVRRDTEWVPDFLDAAASLRSGVSSPRVLTGVEAKILDHSGALDIPQAGFDADLVLIADHQFPGPDGPVSPREMGRRIAFGEAVRRSVLDQLVEATASAVCRVPRALVAHPFSIVPKMGLSEDDLTDKQIRKIAEAAVRTGAMVEINEKWRCPSRRIVDLLAGRGAVLVCGSDAHHCRDVGRYERVRELTGALEVLATT